MACSLVPCALALSTKGHCHQSNANESPIWGVVKGETLFRQTLCKPREMQLQAEAESALPSDKGEAHLYKVPALVPD